MTELLLGVWTHVWPRACPSTFNRCASFFWLESWLCPWHLTVLILKQQKFPYRWMRAGVEAQANFDKDLGGKGTLAVEALSPNHWTTRAFPLITLIVHISTCTLLVKGHTPWYVLMPTTYFEMCPSQKDGTDWNTVDRQTENYTIKEIY